MYRVQQVGQCFYPQHRWCFIWWYFYRNIECATAREGFQSLLAAWDFIASQQKVEEVTYHYKQFNGV